MKNSIQLLLAITLISVAMISCAPMKPIEYKSVDNFTVTMKGLAPEIRADVHLRNPNSMGARIAAMTIDVFIDGTKLSSVCMDTTCVRAVGDFTIPVVAQTNLVDLAKIIPTGLNAFLGKKSKHELPVDIKGNVTVKKFLFSKHFEFEFKEKIALDKFKIL
ncbi:MAG: LEA type 2 family protein [Bacteroidota bacterium]